MPWRGSISTPHNPHRLRDAIAAGAQLAAAVTTVWCLAVILGLELPPPASVHGSTATIAAQREESVGLLFIAPLTVLVGVVAGTFMIAALPTRLRLARLRVEQLRVDTAELNERLGEPYPGYRRGTAWYPSLIVVIFTVAALLVVDANGPPTPDRVAGIAVAFNVLSVMIAVTAIGWRMFRSQPRREQWENEEGPRRLTAGALVTILALGVTLLAATGLDVALLIVGLTEAPADSERTTVLMLFTVTMLAQTAHVVVVSLPTFSRRWLARSGGSPRILDREQRLVKRLEHEQASSGPNGASGEQ